jgi:endonuclease YncB( thermonuclease family)
MLFGIGLVLLGELVGQASVMDADTIEIQGRRLRLIGIDAPESAQWCVDGIGDLYPCGRNAAFALDDFIRGSVVRCEVKDQDRYGRDLAICYKGQTDLNEAMVRAGLALAYRRYDRRYVPQEDEARSEGRGLWQGPFIAPWDWRRGQRLGKNEAYAASFTLSDPLPSCAASDCDCSDFETQIEAQRVLESEKGDPHNLDRNGDGIACESLP